MRNVKTLLGKSFLVMALLFAGTNGLLAQFFNTLTVSGTVLDSASNQPIPNYPVLISAIDSPSGNLYFNVAITDAQGQFIDTLTYSPMGSLDVTLGYTDCQGLPQSLSFPNSASNITTVINTCQNTGGGGSGSCSAFFSVSGNPINPLSADFRAIVPGYSSYSWDFGDGNTGSGAFASHTYSQSGTYTVCLIVDDGQGCRDTVCRPITAGGPPPPSGCDAQFYYFNQIGTQVQFFHAFGFPGSPYSYHWDFGDGSSSTQANPLHAYAVADTYQVCLIVTAPTGTGAVCSDTFCQPVIVNGQGGGCHAYFGYSLSGNTVSFSDSSTHAAHYSWDFGDGNSDTTANPSHTYQMAGIYVVCLTITDSAGNCHDTYCEVILVGNIGPGPCDASFVFQPNFPSQLSMSFHALMPGLSSYNWDFGDGNTATGPNPTHVYATADTYQVCLIVDDGQGCQDTMCMPVIVGVQLPAFCHAAFFFHPDTSALTMNYQALFPGYSSYSWDFGDGNTATGDSVQHTYSTAGTYIVCLAITQTNAAGTVCTDTVCMPVYVGTPPPPPGHCDASYGYQPLGNNSVDFFAFFSASSYSWDFGDGNTGTGRQVTHTYATAGSYNVCLIVDDGQGCLDTVCQAVSTSSPPPPSGFPIFGQVMAGSQPADDYTVFLIVYDSAAGTLTAVDTFRSFGTFPAGFFFFGAVNGDYLVKAALNSGSMYYANYLPTYYGDELLWSNAITVNANSFPFLNINLIPGNNPGGPGFIGGLVSQGANKQGTGDPMEGMHVLLLDVNDQPVAHTTTDANGDFGFTNIAYGTYKVWVEVWGRTPDPYTVTLSPGNASVSGLAFEVHSTEIRALGTTSISDLLDPATGLSMYPNPATDKINLKIGLKQSADLDISLRNLMGQEVYGQVKNLGAGESQLQIPVSDLPAGMYLLGLKLDGEQLEVKKVLVK